MRRNVKKAVAVVSAACMVIGSVPVYNLGPVVVYAEESAQQTAAGAYHLNAASLDAAAFGGLDAAIAADMTVGTENYFTLSGTGGKIKLSQPGQVTYGTNTFNQCIYLTGGLKASGQAGIKVSVPEGKNAKVTVFAAAKSDAVSNLRYFDAAGTATDVDALTFGEVGKYTISDLAAGDYWLGGSNGAFVYYVEVKYTEKYEIDMLTSDAAVGKITADTTIGTSDFFTIMGVEGKNEIKDRSADNITYNGVTYAKSLRLGGKLSTSMVSQD